jgi:hypothetical protein
MQLCIFCVGNLAEMPMLLSEGMLMPVLWQMYIGVTPTSKRQASLEVLLQFALFFQYDVYYKVVLVRATKTKIVDDIIKSGSGSFLPSPEIEDRNEVDVGNWANKMQELCD